MKGFVALLLTFVLFSCNSGNEERIVSKKELKEPLIRENIKITQEESRLIDRFVERSNWDMITTGTGLRYMIYQHGDGNKAEKGMRATVEYRISLLNGNLCYESEKGKGKNFLIGKDKVEAGIHEGVTYMKVGDRAKLIIPAYLGHGLTGDGNKIPPRATLLVDLYLVELY